MPVIRIVSRKRERSKKAVAEIPTDRAKKELQASGARNTWKKVEIKEKFQREPIKGKKELGDAQPKKGWTGVFHRNGKIKGIRNLGTDWAVSRKMTGTNIRQRKKNRRHKVTCAEDLEYGEKKRSKQLHLERGDQKTVQGEKGKMLPRERNGDVSEDYTQIGN